MTWILTPFPSKCFVEEFVELFGCPWIWRKRNRTFVLVWCKLSIFHSHQLWIKCKPAKRGRSILLAPCTSRHKWWWEVAPNCFRGSETKTLKQWASEKRFQCLKKIAKFDNDVIEHQKWKCPYKTEEAFWEAHNEEACSLTQQFHTCKVSKLRILEH